MAYLFSIWNNAIVLANSLTGYAASLDRLGWQRAYISSTGRSTELTGNRDGTHRRDGYSADAERP